MKSIQVNLSQRTITASSRTDIMNKLRQIVKHPTSCSDVATCGSYQNNDNVYAVTVHKQRIKRARKDFVKKQKLMSTREINRYLKLNGLDNTVNPMITYKPTQWVAVVTTIPTVVLRMNNQKVQQNKDSWKLV